MYMNYNSQYKLIYILSVIFFLTKKQCHYFSEYSI